MPRRNSVRAVVVAMAILFATAPSHNALAVFAPGQFITYAQEEWGDDVFPFSPAEVLQSNYNAVYGASGLVEIGLPGPGYSILFTNVSDLLTFLPASGPWSPLTADLTNPGSSMSGAFGGDVMGLRLNIDFADAGVTMGSLGISFGDLVLANLSTLPLLNGKSVRQFSAEMNTLLGGGSGAYSMNQLDGVAVELNSAFAFGNVSQFAQDHLRLGPFLNGDFITHPQASWGSSNPTPTNGSGQMLAHYAAVYPFLSGPFEVGRPGVSTFSIAFTDSGSVINYLPASGPDGPLTSDVINPVTTAAGGFGGEVTALNLNVDFSDAHFTLGSRGIPFGDLELHDTQTIYDGNSVRELLDKANSSLGGGSAFPNIAGLNLLVEELNAAFDGGHVSPWAFTYLRVAAGITGDYSANGIVDADDYVVWRDNLNQSVTLNGDTTPGTVNSADYDVWRAHFGQTAGNGTELATIPEPATAWLLAVAALSSLCVRRK